MKKILFAKVTSAFGIKGEVKIIIYSTNPKNIEKYQLFDAQDRQLKIKISNKNKATIGNSFGNPIIIAKIDGINDRNAAEELNGLEIFALREDFDELPENEFYYSDLIGLDVIDENLCKIGIVKSVSDFGGGAFLEIEFAIKYQNFNKLESIPFKNEFFPEVNLKENFIRLEALEFIELEK